jgi:hypothetical protein
MPLKIVIFGAGAVGGYFGVRLAAVGNDVTFIARGAHFEAMRVYGLRVISPFGNVSLPNVKVVDKMTEADPTEFVFLTVKLWDTSRAVIICEWGDEPPGRADTIRTLFANENVPFSTTRHYKRDSVTGLISGDYLIRNRSARLEGGPEKAGVGQSNSITRFEMPQSQIIVPARRPTYMAAPAISCQPDRL